MANTDPPRYLTFLDSGALPVAALAARLRGEEYRGESQSLFQTVGTKVADALPAAVREWLYAMSGGLSAAPANRAASVDSDKLAEWTVARYPSRRYPAVMIGASNGALQLLCSALCIPWLPQTLMVSLRRKLDPDRPKQDLEWAREPVASLLENNPDLRVYQMSDPNNDRLMLSQMAYLRLKRRRLGKAYEAFLRETLEPGGVIIVGRCELKWPATQVTKDHLFQFGGYGDLPPEEYFKGSDRVASLLARRGASVRSWDPPKPDGDYPEAEWGFDEELLEDIRRFASRHGYRVLQLVYGDPGDPSPLIADLYRWWYGQIGYPTDRLLAPCFVFLQPYLTFTTGSVPFWVPFNSRSSARRLQDYIDTRTPFAEVLLTVFPNGIQSAGRATLGHWKEALGGAEEAGRFVGVDEERYRSGLSTFVEHTRELEKRQRGCPVPEPLSLSEVEKFAAGTDSSVRFQWD